VPFYAAENTALVMGGYFQSQLEHFTRSHKELLKSSCHLPAASTPFGQHFNHQYANYLAAKNFPTQERPQIVPSTEIQALPLLNRVSCSWKLSPNARRCHRC
jgi:hypothetical protein